jgi:sirohydrochlorin ferrochelatase
MVTVSTGIVIFAHGSSVAAANDAVREVAREAAASGHFEHAEVAFLEASPSLEEAVAGLVGAGADRILIVPYFLTLGIHLQRDLPEMIKRLAAQHGQIQIRVAPPLDGHPALARILVDRTRQALAGWS